MLPRPSRGTEGWLTLVNQLSSCHLFVVGGSGSGARVSRGSFSSSSSLSLELLSLSESEELSDSLLSDSPLLECAEATGSGSVCGALGGAGGDGGFSVACSVSLSSLSLSCRSSSSMEVPCWGLGWVFEGVSYCFWLWVAGLTCRGSFVGKGNLDGSAVLGVCMAVRGGGHEWVISFRISSTQWTSLEYGCSTD